MTTPTESTSNVLHHSSFTHNVSPEHVDRAKRNNGEYEVDSPLHQEMSAGQEYVAPQVIKVTRPQKKAHGGSVNLPKEYNDDFSMFPERSFVAQHHHANRIGVEDEHDFHPHLLRNAEDR